MCALPTLYEYYTKDGISSGLTTVSSEFRLNNKTITLYSGALHYFRVHPDLWRDRLRKLRAAGLNCVETYFCWNLHEPEPDVYDFGDGKTDFEVFLNIESFLKIAQEEDLLVIARPGPYICGEWDFGGLPAWLLRNPDIKIRTSDEKYMGYVRNYFGKLLGKLKPFQFKEGGPIIAFQIENEYGNVKEDGKPVDIDYLKMLEDLFRANGISELLFTSDTPSSGTSGSLPDVLYTANFQNDPEVELMLLKIYQPDKPLMVMEYWTGWFDHWTEKHHTRSTEAFSNVLERILLFPSSVNMYMFHGGTNWGFLNGANIADSTTDNSAYQPDTSSYDYDAPLTEAGDYTDKYKSVQECVKKYNKIQTKIPDMPDLIERVAYDQITVSEEINLNNLLQSITPIRSEHLISMENLPINNNSGQKYGYVVYRIAKIDISPNSILKIQGHVCDTVVVLINGQLVSKIPRGNEDVDGFGFWKMKDPTLQLGEGSYENATLDLVVENMGRVNYGKLSQFNQFKGLWQGSVSIDDVELNNWEIYPLEFKTQWNVNLKDWQAATFESGPRLYKGVVEVSDPRDTYIDMSKWTKGIVIINGFVLSRYFKLGPQQTCYVPGPLLKSGKNDILIFEHYEANRTINFSKEPIYNTTI